MNVFVCVKLYIIFLYTSCVKRRLTLYNISSSHNILVCKKQSNNDIHLI